MKISKLNVTPGDSVKVSLTTDIKSIRVVSDVSVNVIASDTDKNSASLETHNETGTNVLLSGIVGRTINITGTSVTSLLVLAERG